MLVDFHPPGGFGVDIISLLAIAVLMLLQGKLQRLYVYSIMHDFPRLLSRNADLPCLPESSLYLLSCTSTSPSSSSSSSWLPFSSSHSALSSPSPLIPQLASHPRNAIPPKTPQGSASPFGLRRVPSEKRPPERNGPAARPAAERVCARPLSVPRTEWLGAELVIYDNVRPESLRRMEYGMGTYE